MTFFQKLALFLGLPVALGTAYLQRTEILRRERELAGLSRQVGQERQTLQRLRGEVANAGAAPTPERAVAEAGWLPPSGDPAADERMRSLVRRVYRLKHWIERTPVHNVPELRFASDGDWFSVVGQFPELDREPDLELAAALLKRQAQFSFLPLFQSALSGYLKISDGVLPARVEDLAPFFVCAIDDAVLARYEMCASGPAGKSGSPVVQEKVPADGDGRLDTVTCNGMGARIASSFPLRPRPRR
ncbi:MAG: hypothetical protein NTV51_11275 [Verrucomicrobia bacterium]|nr:hypothetical protein [Verrucomicrobiota bacterium]